MPTLSFTMWSPRIKLRCLDLAESTFPCWATCWPSTCFLLEYGWRLNQTKSSVTTTVIPLIPRLRFFTFICRRFLVNNATFGIFALVFDIWNLGFWLPRIFILLFTNLLALGNDLNYFIFKFINKMIQIQLKGLKWNEFEVYDPRYAISGDPPLLLSRHLPLQQATQCCTE